MGRYSSGQRGQTVNLLTTSSQVRILLSPQFERNAERDPLWVLPKLRDCSPHSLKIPIFKPQVPKGFGFRIGNVLKYFGIWNFFYWNFKKIAGVAQLVEH